MPEPVAIVMRHRQRPDFWASITVSAREPGRYQVTWHDERGPSGHTCRDTVKEAAAVPLGEGYERETAAPAEALAAVVEAENERAALEAQIASWLAEIGGDT